VDDVSYTRVALKMIQSAANISEDRVYAMGLSNGAFQTQQLACNAAELFDGAAADAGPVGLGNGNEEGLALCDKNFGNHSLDLLLFHGTADPLVPWTGSVANPNVTQGVISALEDAARWVQRMKCSGKLMQTMNDGVFSNLVWPDCRDGATIEFVSVRGGVHTWWTRDKGDNFQTGTYAFDFFDRTYRQRKREMAKQISKSS